MEGFLERSVGRTWYRVTGEGGRTPLVCLHGGPGSTHNYFRPLERLADERPVVVYDQLGCGRSDRPDVAWCLDLFTEELQQLRERLGLEEIHLLGTSWGGMLALEHALAQPGSVRSLVLSSTLASAEEWVVEVRRLRDAIEGDDDQVLEEFERRHFFRGAGEPLELVRMREEKNSEVYEAMWGPNEWTMTGALAGWDVRQRLAELKLPTLDPSRCPRPLDARDHGDAQGGHPARPRGRVRGELAHARPGGDGAVPPSRARIPLRRRSPLAAATRERRERSDPLGDLGADRDLLPQIPILVAPRS